MKLFSNILRRAPKDAAGREEPTAPDRNARGASAAPEDDVVIEFDHFGFQYRAQSEPTLYDINLKIRRGEKVLIAGPSGSGKSTLAQCVNGLIPFSVAGEQTGCVRLNGRDVRELSLFEISKLVGTVLQDSDAQFVGLTVAEDIAFAMENDCAALQRMRETVRRVAGQVGVEGVLENEPHQLSGGQKQRVSLAGVIVDDVRVLLFDEPLASLDPSTGKQAIEMIDEIHAMGDMTVLIIEHRIEDALHRDIDRIVLINDGRIIADLPPDEMLCSGLLEQNGLRDPLYVKALKYAGVALEPGMRPRHVDALRLDEAAARKVREWVSHPGPVPEAAPREPLLEIRDLRFGYGDGPETLHGVNLTVRKGELMCIVGKNGAGKSTLSKLICGFEKPRSGSILMDGEDIAPLTIRERSARVGYVMQNPNQMIAKGQVFEEVALALELNGVPAEQIPPRVEAVLKVCGLYPFRNWPIASLSYGQKKRVTVASILVMEPEVIILDEPTAGQDFRHYTEIMRFIEEINRRGVTVILITHDMHLMLEYATHTVVFADGEIICEDTAARVLTNPDIIRRAALKETSLYAFAVKAGIDDAAGFVQHFIDYDREVRRK